MPNNLTIDVHLWGNQQCRRCGNYVQPIELSAPQFGLTRIVGRACVVCLASLANEQSRMLAMFDELRARGVSKELALRAVRAELDKIGESDDTEQRMGLLELA